MILVGMFIVAVCVTLLFVAAIVLLADLPYMWDSGFLPFMLGLLIFAIGLVAPAWFRKPPPSQPR